MKIKIKKRSNNSILTEGLDAQVEADLSHCAMQYLNQNPCPAGDCWEGVGGKDGFTFEKHCRGINPYDFKLTTSAEQAFFANVLWEKTKSDPRREQALNYLTHKDNTIEYGDLPVSVDNPLTKWIMAAASKVFGTNVDPQDLVYKKVKDLLNKQAVKMGQIHKAGAVHSDPKQRAWRSAEASKAASKMRFPGADPRRLEEGAIPHQITQEDFVAALTIAINEVFQDLRPTQEVAMAAMADIEEALDTIFMQGAEDSDKIARLMGATVDEPSALNSGPVIKEPIMNEE